VFGFVVRPAGAQGPAAVAAHHRQPSAPLAWQSRHCAARVLVGAQRARRHPDLFTSPLLPSLTHLCLTASSEVVVPACLLLSSLLSHLSTHRLHALSDAYASRITVVAIHVLRGHASSPLLFVLGPRFPAPHRPLVFTRHPTHPGCRHALLVVIVPSIRPFPAALFTSPLPTTIYLPTLHIPPSRRRYVLVVATHALLPIFDPVNTVPVPSSVRDRLVPVLLDALHHVSSFSPHSYTHLIDTYASRGRRKIRRRRSEKRYKSCNLQSIINGTS